MVDCAESLLQQALTEDVHLKTEQSDDANYIWIGGSSCLNNTHPTDVYLCMRVKRENGTYASTHIQHWCLLLLFCFHLCMWVKRENGEKPPKPGWSWWEKPVVFLHGGHHTWFIYWHVDNDDDDNDDDDDDGTTIKMKDQWDRQRRPKAFDHPFY